MNRRFHIRENRRIWSGRDVPRFDDTRAGEGGRIVQAADAGEYRVRVTAPEGSVISATAQVHVLFPPRITDIVRLGAVNRISFPTVAGLSYTLEYKAAFADANWTGLTTTSGTGDVLTIQDTQPGADMRLYRLRVE